MKITIPDMLYIETTNICNANCIFCAYQYDTRPKNVIDFELFKKIVLRYKEVGGKHISLSPFAGEIFSEPNILKKINFLKEQCFDVVYTYTNALLFHKFDIIEILNSGLTSINISMAPLDEELYIKIYRNKSYSQLLKNMSNFLNAFNGSNEKTIQKISIEFRSNMPMKDLQKLPDYINFIEPYLNEHISVSCMQTFDSWMGTIVQDDLVDGMKIKDLNFDKPKPCIRLNMLQVLANGDTRVCGCRYNNNEDVLEDVFNVGNAKDEDIIAMYNKQKVFVLKQSFYDKQIPLECKLCSWYEGVKE